MPWSDYPADVRQFSGLVQAAAQTRYGSAATVELVSRAARDAGLQLSFRSYSSIAAMYGQFAQVREARSTLTSTAAQVGRTGLDLGITPTVIASPPWSPSARDQALNPFVLVRGRYAQETPEGAVSGYFTHRYSLAEVHTYSQVMADMQAQMDQNAGGTDLSGAAMEEIVGIEWSTP